jgi:hypothetical protein
VVDAMKYECTDCCNCANFSDGFRIYCLSKILPPDEVLLYLPVGDRDAYNCKDFDEGDSIDFVWEDMDKYEKWCDEVYGELTYKGIREWCEKELHKR